MLKIKKVAVTGTLSSGKSAACQILKELGAYVVSADEIVHRLLSPETAIGEQILQLFNATVLNSQGEFDRKAIADLVFKDPQRLKALGAIIHPAVFKEIDDTYRRVESTMSVPLFVAEVPLLYEAEQEGAFDAVLVIRASEENCRNRFGNNQDFNNRSARQLPSAAKSARASYVIDNNSSLEELRSQIKQFFFQITSRPS